ncbi:MAG: LuxR C-terminal-related transcriptional regulator [Balneolaceae bacterium]|nr:LuxR C-terminal-related transcriptional regulator [Balneolaceae bacterium]
MKKRKRTSLSDKVANLQRFMDRYGDRIEQLSDLEIRVLILISNGLDSAEIAEALMVGEEEIEILKERIKDKLMIDSQDDFEEYAVAFDLIRIWFDSLSLVIERENDTNFTIISRKDDK